MAEYSMFILILSGIILIFAIILATVALYLNYKHKKTIERLTKYSVNVSAIIDDTVPLLLEKFIDHCFDDYKVMKLIPLNEGYITDEREKSIRNDLVEIVINRISPNMIDKLSLYYNDKNIAAVLSDKIYIVVMNYVVDHNRIMGKNSK